MRQALLLLAVTICSASSCEGLVSDVEQGQFESTGEGSCTQEYDP